MVETAKRICRVCLQQVVGDADFYSVNDNDELMLESKLLDFLPEMDLSYTPNSILCHHCTTTIKVIQEFKQLCLPKEETVKKLRLHDVPTDRHTEKNLKCDKCDYRTNQPSNLKVHMLRHMGVRPYKCEKCDYHTRYLSYLKVHSRKHSSGKPHVRAKAV